MALVLVVAGVNSLVLGPQFERSVRVALEVHAVGFACQRDEGQHVSRDLEHGDVISEGIVLGRARQAWAQIDYLVPCHRIILPLVSALMPASSTCE